MDFRSRLTLLINSKVRHFMSATLIMLLFLIVAAGCSNQKARYLIGVSQCSNDEWRDKQNSEYRMMSYIDDSIDIVIKTTNDDSRGQIAQIDSLIDMGADLLIVSPNQSRELTPIIEKAYKKGIPVVLFDRKISSDKYTAYIGGDNYCIGYGLGQYVAGQINEKGRVAEVQGLENSSPATERHRGFMDAIKRYPGIKVVAEENANWEQQGGEAAMDRILSRTADIDYVFAHNDRMAYGAYLSLKRHGMQHKVRLIGVDGLTGGNGGVDLVCRGILDASYLYPTSGDIAIKLAKDILAGKQIKKYNTLNTSIITKDNAELTRMASENAIHQMAVLEVLHNQVDRYATYNRTQYLLIWGLVAFAVFVVAAAIFLYRGYQAKNRMSVQLIKKTADLEKLNTEVVELTQSRMEFFTNVSHELRTPLTLIADPVDTLLTDDKIKGSERKLLGIVKRNAMYLLYLVNDLMDFRKIQTGKMKLRLAKFGLAEKVGQWAADFIPTAEQRGITIVIDTDKFNSRYVIADEEKICRILYNLIGNALKYTEPGGTVTVSLRAVPDDKVQLRVSDTGKGISEEDCRRVFDRFYQAHGAVGGTGIGLAVVKAYTELHGGTAEVESTIGAGSSFTVTIPCEQPGTDGCPSAAVETESRKDAIMPPPAEVRSAAVGSIITVDEKKDTVLVVDDNADIRTYLADILSDTYNVLEASDGSIALNIARRDVPDIVLCDVMMPVMDGLQLCREIKKDPAVSHIPVILLTAKNRDEHKIEGYEEGADSYITKPFNSKLLLSRMDNLLKNRKQLRGLFRGSMPEDVDDRQLGSSEKQFISSLRGIIQKKMSDPDFGVEEIGQEMGLSRVQLYRKVKALTGASVVDLLRKARLQRAKILLEKTNKSISETAYDVGFSSPSYFTKCFKEEFDLLPGEIRK